MNDPQFNLPHALQLALHYYQQGRWAQAESLYRQVLQYQPKHAEALNWLGVCRAQQGDAEQALVYVQQAVQQEAKNADYQNNLGNLYLQQKLFAEAQACFVKALKLNPKFATAYLNLGVACKEQKNLKEAVDALRKAVKFAPQYTKAWYTLGSIYTAQKQLEAAQTAIQKALKLEPNNAEALTAMGNWYREKRQLDTAIRYYQKALSIRPDFAEAFKHLGAAQMQAKEYMEALQAYQKALELSPEADLACAVGVLLSEKLYQKTAALDYFELALQLDDACADAYNGIAAIYVLRGEIERALAYFQQAKTLAPDNHVAWLNEAFIRNYTALEPLSLFVESQKLHEQYPSATFPAQLAAQHRARKQRLRIGYLSNDLRDHSVAYFMQSIFAQHDKHQFEIFVYHRYATLDAMSEHLRGLVEHWHGCGDWTHEQCVKQMRQDQLDILLDLNGLTHADLVTLLTQKPAPLQMAYLGYSGTTGLACMDYRLVDAHTEPPEYAQQYSSERLLYLPHSYFCYQPPPAMQQLAITPPPVLRNGFITFGSFNNAAKISDDTIAAWATLLHQVADARLLLKTKMFGDEVTQALFKQRFAHYGISEERLIFQGIIIEKTEHLSFYSHIDIALDTYPYNGATTTCEALWMGVPVVSCCGKTHPSRMGLSILSTVGLADWVSDTPDGLVQTAVALAQDLPRLQMLRSSIREQMQRSPLMQAETFTRHLEQLYRQAWADYCQEN